MSSFDNLLEYEHNRFVKTKEFNKMVQERIEYSNYYKYQGMAPEGFVLIPTEVLEKLKDFDTWKEWKHNPSILEDMSKIFLKNQ